MAVRDFIDATGVPWRVWETRPTTDAIARPGYEAGWLTFESPAQLRRLAPIPAQWEQVPDEQLERLCRRAVDGRRRRVPMPPAL